MSWPPVRETAPFLPIAAGVLRAVVVLQVVAGLAVLPVAAFLVLGDLSDHTDEWDGFVALLAVLAAGVALLLVGVGALVLRLLRRRPTVAGAIATAVGALALLQGLHRGAGFGLGAADVGVVLVGLALAVPGVAVVWAARTVSQH